MPLRRASLLLPCARLDDFPTHLTGERAADLLAAWTALWHPALIAATTSLPAWHPADSPPDPAELEGELVLIPSASRQRLAGDWCDRLRATAPKNPPPIHALASRAETVTAVLAASSLEQHGIAEATVADFLALGHAHLQVELLTRAMRYTSVLDTEQFTGAVVAAAKAAAAGGAPTAEEELARAFDLLMDARNHVYAVDFYVIDVTLVAASTLGDSLRAKLASGLPTSLLLSGEMLEQMAGNQPETLLELRRALETGKACIVGGFFHADLPAASLSLEALLAELEQGQSAARSHLEREYEVFGQFNTSFSSLLPQILSGCGFRAALHASFDGGRLPKPDQCKTWWGQGEQPWSSQGHERAAVQALATVPLDVARSETWLKFATRVGDTIARDHVATVLLAGWPGAACEYYADLRRAARFGPLLGKLVTLEEYFRITREPDEWTTFAPREYPIPEVSGPNPISTRVDDHRRDTLDQHKRLGLGLAAAADLQTINTKNAGTDAATPIVINPWSFACSQFMAMEPLDCENPYRVEPDVSAEPRLLPDVPACGYTSFASAATEPPAPLVDGRTLRNERLEVTISEATGGIQSLRTYRDRGTRLSQRLVFHRSAGAIASPANMVAESVQVTRDDTLIGEITSQGRLQSHGDELLARFAQRVRVVRGLPAAIVDVQLEPELDRLPSGNIWKSYFASRLAWGDEALAFRCGRQWTAVETRQPQIESSEWVEVQDGIGTVTCFALGLPFHRPVGATWLDTLLIAAGEQQRRFQFALAIDDPFPSQTALALMTAAAPPVAHFPAPPASPMGWFLHVAARNVLVTHIDRLGAPRHGVRLRVLETEGRQTITTLAAFRPFRAASITDFRGQSPEVLSVASGSAEFDIGPHRWIQLEAEW